MESKNYERHTETIIIPPAHVALRCVSRDGLSGTILASLVLDILRNITTGGDITGGFCPGAVFLSCRYIGSVRIISEPRLVCPNGRRYLLKKMGVDLSQPKRLHK
jgi:hypothetical protein